MEPAAASVYSWKGRFFVHPMFVRGAYGKASMPVACLGADATDMQFGQALQDALHASARIRRKPADGESAKILKQLGARSWDVLMREAHTVQVARRSAGIGMTPMHYWIDVKERERGLRGEEEFLVKATATSADLGRELRRLLQRPE